MLDRYHKYSNLYSQSQIIALLNLQGDPELVDPDLDHKMWTQERVD